MRQYTKNNYKYTILENVEAGYIRKRGDEYVITPAVKLENKSTRQGNKRGRLHSYIPVHEYELRKKNIKGANFLYCKEMKKEDYKKESRKEENINKKYEPYYMDIRYNINGDKPEIDMNGKFKGMLANSNYMNKKVHHYLIFEQDNKSEEIIISKAQAELYMDDLIYTKKMDKDKKEMEKKYKYYALPEKDEVKPVFYIKKDKDVLFGFTPYLRLSAKEAFMMEYLQNI